MLMRRARSWTGNRVPTLPLLLLATVSGSQWFSEFQCPEKGGSAYSASVAEFDGHAAKVLHGPTFGQHPQSDAIIASHWSQYGSPARFAGFVTSATQPLFEEDLDHRHPSSNEPLRILDCGSGAGGFSLAMLDAHRDVPVEFIGVDPSGRAIDLAKKLVASTETQKMKWCQGMCEDLLAGPTNEAVSPAAAAHNFDIILVNGVLGYFEELDSIKSLLKTLLAMAKPSAKLFFGHIHGLEAELNCKHLGQQKRGVAVSTTFWKQALLDIGAVRHVTFYGGTATPAGQDYRLNILTGSCRYNMIIGPLGGASDANPAVVQEHYNDHRRPETSSHIHHNQFGQPRSSSAYSLKGGLDASGWKYDERGEIVDGQPKCTGAGGANFKHSQDLKMSDVLRMRVEGGQNALVGLCGEAFDVEKPGETGVSTTLVDLFDGTTVIDSDLSLDGQQHIHLGHLGPHIPKAPYDLALRCEAVSKVPQIQFNDDKVWHDFAPNRVALKAGPWFPYLMLLSADVRLTVPGPQQTDY